MADKKRENKRKARIKDLKKNKYYYAFVAIVLIIVILIVGLDYKYRFGFIEWGSSESVSVKVPESYENEHVDEIRDLTIKFIDVGQGDAIFITFPDGKTMLVDAGNNGSSVEKSLEKHISVDGNKPTLDYVVATHSDADHIGSMDYVYENYEVLKSYRPYENLVGDTTFPNGFNLGFNDIATSGYKNYLLGIVNEGTNWEFFTDESYIATTVSVGEELYKYTVDFVMPYAKTVDSFSEFDDSNDMSSVIIIEFADRKIMLTGDMEKEAEKAFVNYYKDRPDEVSKLDCDVLKVAHHGSATSSSASFLSLVKPEHAVISCGVCNGNYMHPRAEALNNIIAIQNSLIYNSESPKGIYRTDLQGTIVLTVTPEGKMSFSVETNEFDEYLLLSAYEIEEHKDEIKEFKSKL